MVDQSEACEYWLPPEFLTDEDFAFNFKQSGSKEEVKKAVSDSFSGFGSSGTNSDMGSPVESVVSYTESESDEDEYITGLTRDLSRSTLEENSCPYENKKPCKLPSSPKSPLCNVAGEFSRRKMVSETPGLHPPRNEPCVPMEQPGPNFGFPTNYHQLSYQQLLAVRHLQLQQLRRQQMINQTQQNRVIKNGERMPMGLPVSAFPPLQRYHPKPQAGTGMRAVFLGNDLSGAKKPCAGTGVFLPRPASSTENPKTKPVCSPVLIPDRVVQALNLNLETLGVQNQAHRRPGYYNNNNRFSAGPLNQKNKMKKKNALQSIAREEAENQEVFRLPPEWTY